MLHRTFAAFLVICAVTLFAPSATADDVSSVYPAAVPPQWNGPAIGLPGSYYITTQGGQPFHYDLGGSPSPLTGTTSSDIDASNGGSAVAARGVDGTLWLNHSTGSGYTGWNPIHGKASAGPSVAKWFETGREFVVARGNDNALWVREALNITDPYFIDWTLVGGSLSSDPDASIGPNGLLYVTARGDDGAVWINAFNGTAWGGWATLGGSTSSGPSIAYNGTDGYVLTRGDDAAIWANHLTAAGWGGWFSIGGLTGIQPPLNQGGYAIDAFIGTDDTVSFVTVGADGNLWDGNYSPATGPSFRRIG